MRLRKGFWIVIPALLLALFGPISSAKADSFTTTGAQDYFFTIEQQQLFTVRTYAQQYGIDSMLWLYDSNNQVLAANDDSQYGLDSYISMDLAPGTYRLRTGVCCGDPNGWYGTSYVVDVNIAPSNPPETTTSTTTSTTTTTTTTTTTVPPTTTTTVEPYYNAVENLTAVTNEDGSVTLNWDAPDASNIEPYIYTITWFDLNEGVESGGWGVWTRAENTSYTVGAYQFPGTSGYGPVRFKVSAGNAPCVGEGNGSCIYGPHASVDATVSQPVPATTTTTTTTTIPSVPHEYAEVYENQTLTLTAPNGYVFTEALFASYGTPNGYSIGQCHAQNSVQKVEEVFSGQTAGSISASNNVFGDPCGGTGKRLIVAMRYEAISPPTTTTTTTTTTSTTTTTVPTTTTTQPAPVVVPVLPEPATTIPEETTTTTEATLPEETTTTTTEPEMVTTTTEPSPQTTVTIPELDQLDNSQPIDAEVLDAIIDNVTLDNNTSAEEASTILLDVVSADIPVEQLQEVMNAVFSESASQEQVVAVVENLLSADLSTEELAAVFDAVFDGDLSAEDTVALAESILETPLSAEEFSTVINAIFDEKVSDEVLLGTFGAVLSTELDEEKFAKVVNVLENANITNDQVSEVVDLIIGQEEGVSSDQATELATSAKVLESIDASQATEVFDAVVVAEVSLEEGEAISEALADAPVDVKESFEEEINVFAGVFDTYVAVGSSIDVGDRRTLVAAGAAVAAVGAATGAAPTTGPTGPSGGSTGPSGGNSGGGGDIPAPDRKNGAKKQRRARQRARVK